MRIATWNVERPGDGDSSRTKRILAKLEEIAADIWILTETHETVRPKSGAHQVSSPNIEAAPISHRVGEHKVTVWSRWPMLNRYEVSMVNRAAWTAIETPIGDLIVYGTVIPYHGARWPYGTKRNWDAHYAAIAVQGAEWGRLRQKYPSSGMCVAGDFNQNRTGAYKYGSKWGRKLLDLALEENGLTCVTQLGHPLTEELVSSEK